MLLFFNPLLYYLLDFKELIYFHGDSYYTKGTERIPICLLWKILSDSTVLKKHLIMHITLDNLGKNSSFSVFRRGKISKMGCQKREQRNLSQDLFLKT